MQQSFNFNDQQLKNEFSKQINLESELTKSQSEVKYLQQRLEQIEKQLQQSNFLKNNVETQLLNIQQQLLQCKAESKQSDQKNLNSIITSFEPHLNDQEMTDIT